MKNSKIWHILWIGGMFACLLLTLYLIINYKVEWEDKDLNTYLYVYEIDNNLYTSTTKPPKYYNKIKCKEDICPYVEHKNNTVLLMNDTKNKWLYDYEQDKILSNNYKDYKFLGNDNYIVKNDENLYNIIDLSNKELLKTSYKEIIDFKNDYLVYKDETYHIKNIKDDKEVEIPDKINNIKIINDKYYLYELDNKYCINSIYTNEKVKEYNYILNVSDKILVFYDKKMEILNDELINTLIMPLGTHYEYIDAKERDSLKIDIYNEILTIKIVLEDNKYTTYRYDLQNNKLI